MTVPNNANTYLPGVIQIPSTLEITAITQSYPAVTTISIDAITASNTYIAGQLVRLNIPYPYGMQQAAGQQVKILSNVGSNITLDMDSRNFDPFIVPSGNVSQPASMAPAGSRNLQYNNSTDFVGFQSLNNRGN